MLVPKQLKMMGQYKNVGVIVTQCDHESQNVYKSNITPLATNVPTLVREGELILSCPLTVHMDSTQNIDVHW